MIPWQFQLLVPRSPPRLPEDTLACEIRIPNVSTIPCVGMSDTWYTRIECIGTSDTYVALHGICHLLSLMIDSLGATVG